MRGPFARFRVLDRIALWAGSPVACCLLGGTLLVSTARFSWVGVLCSNVRFMMGMGGALAAGLLIVAWRPRLAGAALVFSLLHLVPARILSIETRFCSPRLNDRNSGALPHVGVSQAAPGVEE